MIAIRKSSGKELSLLGILAVVLAMTVVLAAGATVVSAEDGAGEDPADTGSTDPGTSETPTVSEEEGVAKIGDTYYKTLVDALKAVKTGETITLTKNILDGVGIGIFYHFATSEVPEYYTINGDTDKVASDITIDFDGHTYTVATNPVGSPGTESQGLHLEKGYKLTLKNGTLTSDGSVEYKYPDESKTKLTGAIGVKFLIQNYCDLTLDNMVLDGSKLINKSVSKTGLLETIPVYTVSNNNGTSVFTDTTIIAHADGFAFDVCGSEDYPNGVSITVEGKSSIEGDIQISSAGNTLPLELNVGKEAVIKGEFKAGSPDAFSHITLDLYGYDVIPGDGGITITPTEYIYTFIAEGTSESTQIKFTRNNIGSQTYPGLPTSTKDNYTYKWNSEGFTLENKVVTAVYTPIEYTVTWVVDGVLTETTYTIETPLVLLTQPDDKLCDYGHVISKFVGWKDEDGNEAVEGAEVSADITYTAQFEPVEDKFTVTWKTDKDSYVKTETVDCGADPVPPQYPEFAPKDGYEPSLDYWTLDGERVDVFGKVTSDVTYIGVPKYTAWTVSTIITIDYPYYNSAGILDLKEVSVEGINLTWGFTVSEIMDAIRANKTAAALIGDYATVLLEGFDFAASPDRQALLDKAVPADYTLSWTLSDPKHYCMFTVMCADESVFTVSSSTLVDGGWVDGTTDVALDLGKDNKARIYIDTWKGLPFYGPATVTCTNGDIVTITPMDAHSYGYEVKGLTAGECDVTVTVAGFDFTFHVTATGTPAPAPGNNDSSIWPVVIVCLIAAAIALFVIIRRNAS